MKRYFDAKNNRLIYLNHAASKDFWDKHWLTEDVRKDVNATPKSWVALTTRKFLQS